jgi:hypothetical protein
MSATALRRATALAASTILAVVLGAPPANAAPPSNDAISRAQVITNVSSRFTVDTTDATTNRATDVGGPDCMGGHSVWYRFRPTRTVTARVITLGSEFDTVLGVFRGTPSRLIRVACNDDTSIDAAVQVRFVAGTTYFIALSACCADEDQGGGNAVLRTYVPSAFGFTESTAGSQAGEISGRAYVTGTANCTNPGLYTKDVLLSQRVGTQVARGIGEAVIKCSRTTRRWTVVVDSETSTAFRPGRAAMDVARDVTDGFASRFAQSSGIVTLVSAPNALAHTRPSH